MLQRIPDPRGSRVFGAFKNIRLLLNKTLLVLWVFGQKS